VPYRILFASIETGYHWIVSAVNYAKSWHPRTNNSIGSIGHKFEHGDHPNTRTSSGYSFRAANAKPKENEPTARS